MCADVAQFDGGLGVLKMNASGGAALVLLLSFLCLGLAGMLMWQRRQLRLAAQACSERSAAQRELLLLLAHELRSPVATLDAAFSNLAGQTQGPQAAALLLDPRRFERMERALKRIKQVMSDCLSDERLAGLSSSLAECAHVSAEKIVAQALNQLDAELRPRVQVQLPSDADAALLPQARVSGDLALLGAALKNLIDNALKYGGPGPVQVGMAVCGAQLALSVRDHGPGLDDQARATLFQKFARGRSPAQPAGVDALDVLDVLDAPDALGVWEGFDGLGLGLHLAEQIVRRHGGALRLSLANGGGTLAMMSLPLLGEQRAG
jgi:signal transduction histidine kinase